MEDQSWSFLGGPGSWPYRIFDAQRRRVNQWLVTRLLSRTAPAGQGRVLEAGSGPGYGSSLFARHPSVLMSIALDFDAAALREARRRDPGLLAVLGDVRRLPFRTEAFDVVWNSSTLEHLEQPDVALGEMQRVTRSGGHVFVGVPYRFGPLGFQRFIARTRVGVWIGPVFDRAALCRLLTAQRLQPVEHLVYFAACFIGVLSRKPAAPIEMPS